ncbi:alginate O-acetyltransferase [Candidatus Peregrinibacteria bacterium RIFOXYC2_FULL_33_13]|nr:MAG: putative poly(Beta-D-mannuronate) O-acetylase [Candidatus Peregrinibacteria bacterium GW2011_GWA2_33_10]KKP39596.1 MAG: alginate O-acetylation protein [Candidatus Peregrinibacteria bacterium GW2011_GWC2_33_13]OGJ50202.1 MAG: alginate O-acetyltransferase [Candidatus Peregrinibacteria bacterium RIFOXYA2_FULL_33_7]OGJ54040.1 MAG: alginate O-acetyltransferase [Candidatus Peregrinibacteria bacterium RIFOXYC2_FULL_33_13]
MAFNSISFLFFFPLVVSLYFIIPHKFRWIILLLSSYYFYMSWNPDLIILIIITTLISYATAIQIYKTKNKKRKKLLLIFSIIINLGILFTFKYFNFFSEALKILLQNFSIKLDPITLKLVIPIGISFYTFQTLSYTIDVYRGNFKPEKHPGIFAVYISFFPQLVAGPIERAKNLLPQFFEKHYFDYKKATDGLKLMLWGFFKKIVIADRLAMIVNTIYENPSGYNSIALITATIFFAFQIYCDFSGYSDIAIGAAQVMGFNLMDNFKRPYFSRSINEFWKRWHISLSTWFKDYVYIPLGGNKVNKIRRYFNLLTVFLISGLWHGAKWTFVIWGLLHGLYLILELILKPIKNKIMEFMRLTKLPKLMAFMEICFTFILINIAWIFFRANNLPDAIYIIKNIFTEMNFNINGINIGVGWTELIMAIGVILFMEFIHLIEEHKSIREFLDSKPKALRWSIYLIIIYMILIFGVFEKSEFIYFQF